jgi:hypothetical protein
MTNRIAQICEDRLMYEAILTALIVLEGGKICLSAAKIASCGNRYRLCVQADWQSREVELTVEKIRPANKRHATPHRTVRNRGTATFQPETIRRIQKIAREKYGVLLTAGEVIDALGSLLAALGPLMVEHGCPAPESDLELAALLHTIFANDDEENLHTEDKSDRPHPERTGRDGPSPPSAPEEHG